MKKNKGSIKDFGGNLKKSKKAYRVDECVEAEEVCSEKPYDNEDSKKLVSSFEKWSVYDNGDVFAPCGTTEPKLDAGVYNCSTDPNGRAFFAKQPINVDSLLFFKDSIFDEVLQEIEKFWELEHNFVKHGFLHRRGFLFYGPPGSGKSALIQQIIADVVKRDYVVIMSCHPHTLTDCLGQLRKVEPKRKLICLFEDLDAYIRRYNEDKVLSLLDGENQLDNVLNIACPAPETRILKADLTWVRADTLKVSDELIAFDEYPLSGGFQKGKHSGRKYRTAVVQSCPIIQKPRYRIVFEHGNIVVSEKHPFLIKRGNRPVEWRFSDDLKKGNKICFIGSPWKFDTSWESGYLSGQYDGEGSLNLPNKDGKGVHHRCGLVWGQAEGFLVDEMRRIIENFGFRVKDYRRVMGGGGCVEAKNYKDQIILKISGGRWATLRMLGRVRPFKMLNNPRLKECWEGSSLQTQYSKVLSVEYLGEGPVVALDTSTSTFIGEGLLQHNTTNYPENLDPRIVNRPRRFDNLVFIGMPNDSIRKEYFLKKLNLSEKEVNKWVKDSEGFSFAALAEAVISIKCLKNTYKDTFDKLKLLQSQNLNSDNWGGSRMGFSV